MSDTLTLQQRATATTQRAPRLDLYAFIHKALRQFMHETLARLGRLDVEDSDERNGTLDQVDALLQQLRCHVQHENDFIHTAIEARRPGASRHTADDHLLHGDAIGNLEDESRALRNGRADQRAALAQRLYRHLAAFVGENLQHMHIEETENNATLWALYTDPELADLHDRLVGSLPPDEMALTARWMAAALNPQELALVFGDIQRKAPAAALQALLDVTRPVLSDTRWAQLNRALGRPPVPGLVDV